MHALLRWGTFGLMILACLGALATLVTTAQSLGMMLDDPGGSTVGAYGFINEPGGPSRHVITFAGWPGLLFGVAMLILVPLSALLVWFPKAPKWLGVLCWTVLAVWLGRWAYGFGMMVATFGESTWDTHMLGAATAALCFAGALVGLACAVRSSHGLEYK